MLILKEECPMFDYIGGRSWILLITVLMAIILIASCGSPKAANPTKKADPQQLQKMELLNRTADDMYKKAMDGQMMEARNMLLQLSDQITHIQFQGVTSIEGLHALTTSITEAKRVYNAASLSHIEGQTAAAQIRLATDALTHASQPMWLQYDKVLRNDLTNLEQAVKASNEQETVINYEKLKQHIFLIHPSLQISRDPSLIEKLDSIINFIQTGVRSKPMASQNVVKGIEQLQHTLDQIFNKRQEATAYLPLADNQTPIIWVLLIGAIISTVLTYAGWRMFKTDRNTVAVNKKEKG
jgi:sporulation protein YpjB